MGFAVAPGGRGLTMGSTGVMLVPGPEDDHAPYLPGLQRFVNRIDTTKSKMNHSSCHNFDSRMCF